MSCITQLFALALFLGALLFGLMGVSALTSAKSAFQEQSALMMLLIAVVMIVGAFALGNMSRRRE